MCSYKEIKTSSGVYEILNTVNGKRYIGSSFSNIRRRAYEHFFYLRRGSHHSSILQRAYDKYGESSFKFNILHETPSEYSRILEQWYLNTQPCEYNSSKCAVGGLNKNSISKKSIIRKLNLFSEFKGKYSVDAYAYSGLNPDLLRRILSGESYSYYNINNDLIKKCSKKRKELKPGYWKNKKRSSKTKKKISNSLKGRKNEKISIGVICLNDNKKYKSLYDAAKHYNLDPNHVSLCCRGEISNTKNYNFKFIDGYKPVNRVNEKQVICLEKNEVFKNAKKAAMFFETKAANIRECCNKKRRTRTKNGLLTFRYTKERGEKHFNCVPK